MSCFNSFCKIAPNPENCVAKLRIANPATINYTQLGLKTNQDMNYMDINAIQVQPLYSQKNDFKTRLAEYNRSSRFKRAICFVDVSHLLYTSGRKLQFQYQQNLLRLLGLSHLPPFWG